MRDLFSLVAVAVAACCLPLPGAWAADEDVELLEQERRDGYYSTPAARTPIQHRYQDHTQHIRPYDVVRASLAGTS